MNVAGFSSQTALASLPRLLKSGGSGGLSASFCIGLLFKEKRIELEFYSPLKR
jgi:hypothetical protein